MGAHYSRGRGPRLQRSRARSLAGLALACLAVFTLTVVVGLRWSDHLDGPDAPRGQPQLSATVVRVIDGDTFELADGKRVRILNIDTAEMPPRSRCVAEERAALAARARLVELTSSARQVTLRVRGRDRDDFGRLLRLVAVDGRDVGEILISEGLAQRWIGRKAEWC